MRIIDRIRILEERLKPATDWNAIGRDFARITQAWDEGESWEIISTELSPATIAMLEMNAETWTRQMAESIATFDKTFGSGSFAKNRADQKEWQAAAAKAGT